MAAYYKVDVSLSTNSVTVGMPSPQEVIVTLPLVGPQGPAGPAGEGGVTSVAGRTGAVTLAVADVANAVATSDSRLTDARTPLSHAHGNLTNAGAIGTTSGLPIKTGTSGVIEAGAFGTAAGSFCEGNDARIATIGSGTINTSAVNGSAGSINTSDNNGQSSGGSIDTSGSNEAGGSILTYGGASEAGGSISTYNGGGSINTRGTGSIELGGTGTRTTLTGTATEDRAISLPNASGTLALASLVGAPAELVIACSDETTNLTTGTNKVTFRMPYAMTLSSVRASVNTAPTGSTLVVDINEGGSTILSTKLSIDASEFTSTTAATAAVISDTALADDALITIDIDQIGSTIAGKGLKVVLKGTRA